MTLAQLFALDLVAIILLVFAVYFPRHRRRDMIVALLGINIGVLGVTQGLSSAGVSAGLGLGLFGVLSIIRLRSTEMDQGEVAYYFAALTLGLLGGFVVEPAWLSVALMAAIVGAVAVGDHPRLFARYRHQVITLDRAGPTSRSPPRSLLGPGPQPIIRTWTWADTTVSTPLRLTRASTTSADQPAEATEVAS